MKHPKLVAAAAAARRAGPAGGSLAYAPEVTLVGPRAAPAPRVVLEARELLTLPRSDGAAAGAHQAQRERHDQEPNPQAHAKRVRRRRSIASGRSASLLGACAVVALAVAAQGCGNGEKEGDPCAEPAGTLEIGVRGEDGMFEPLVEGETAYVTLGANGLNMVQPSLRVTEEIDPRGPDPTIEVWVGGLDQPMAADIEGSRVPMQHDGTGQVLRDLRVPFQTELCCYVCREGDLQATLVDARDRCFVGGLTVMLKREFCPDPPACCASDQMCPDPELTLVCGEE